MVDTHEAFHFAGTQSITPRIVVRGAALAADGYKGAPDARGSGLARPRRPGRLFQTRSAQEQLAAVDEWRDLCL